MKIQSLQVRLSKDQDGNLPTDKDSESIRQGTWPLEYSVAVVFQHNTNDQFQILKISIEVTFGS